MNNLQMMTFAMRLRNYSITLFHGDRVAFDAADRRYVCVLYVYVARMSYDVSPAIRTDLSPSNARGIARWPASTSDGGGGG